ncbi:hypothetical protein [Allocoleopsis sp.]|uniref:hypothetical protein n=1 Tax=Allocoleopsis sp. TaxID=3088169 RepID=UPI002FD3189F
MLVKIKPMQSRKATGNPSPSSISSRAGQMFRRVHLLPLYCLVFGVGLIGCSNSGLLGISGFNMGANAIKIRDISQNPNNDAIVYLQGQVTNRAPLLDSSAYQLKDATGSIWVFTNQNVPNLGDEVSIKGKLQFQSIPVGGQELGEVYVQEEQLLNRKPGNLEQPVVPEASP